MRNFLAAARPVLIDSLGVLVFAVLISLHVSLAISVSVGVAIAGGLVIANLVRRRPVGTLQWVSLAFVLISGGLALWMNDPRFVMIKPTVGYGILGGVLLRRGWMLPYVPAHLAGMVLPAASGLLIAFGYIWAGLMFATAAANAVVAGVFTSWWPLFIGTVPLVSKVLLFCVQYVLVRARVRGHMAAA